MPKIDVHAEEEESCGEGLVNVQRSESMNSMSQMPAPWPSAFLTIGPQ